MSSQPKKEKVYYVGGKVYKDAQSAAAANRLLKQQGLSPQQIKNMSLATKKAAEMAAIAKKALPPQMSKALSTAFKPTTLSKEVITKSIQNAPPSKASVKTATIAGSKPGKTDITTQNKSILDDIYTTFAAPVEYAKSVFGQVQQQEAPDYGQMIQQELAKASSSLLASFQGTADMLVKASAGIGSSFGVSPACPQPQTTNAAPMQEVAYTRPDATSDDDMKRDRKITTTSAETLSNMLGQLKSTGFLVIMVVIGGIVTVIYALSRRKSTRSRHAY